MNTYGIEQAFASWYGAAIMFIIIGISIYMVALVIVRMLFFRRIRVNSEKLLQDVQSAVSGSKEKQMDEFKASRPTDSPIRILVGTALSNAKLNASNLTEVLAIARVRQKQRLTRGLSAFGTMATIAPFIGLLGTVIGIVESFHNLAQTGAAGPNVVASGVAAALWATACGLCVAIPAVVAYNVFNGKAKNISTDMEVASRELVLILTGDKSAKVNVPKAA